MVGSQTLGKELMDFSEGLYETLITNLWIDEFPAEDIKILYKMRWGIETSFRELKYHG